MKFCLSGFSLFAHICNFGIQLLWHIIHAIVSLWYSLLAMGYLLESYLISRGVLKSYKPLHLGKLRYLAIVIDSEDAHQTSKIVQLLQWLSFIGIKNVCLYDVDGVLKKSKEAILQKLKEATGIQYDLDHMTLEFVSYMDGKEAVTKAANLIFMENLKQYNSGGELDGQILIENDLDEALLTVGSRGPEPDLLLVYGPVRCHLGFPAWRLRYTEIVHMGSINSLRCGSLIKAICNFSKVHQNYGT